MEQHYYNIKINVGNLRINFILSNGFFYINDPWQMAMHSHSTYELHYIYEGNVDFESDNSISVVNSGEMLFVPAYKYHSVKKHSQPFVKTSLIFGLEENRVVNDPGDSYSYYRNLYSNVDKITRVTPEASYFKALRQCIESYIDSGKLNSEKFRALLKLIFIDISEQISKQYDISPVNATPLRSDDGSENMIRAKQIEDYIHINFKENISVEDLAHFLHLSVRQTNRFLKENMNIRFSGFVRKYRIELAKAMLLEYDIPLQQIAYEVGYNSYNGFLEAFQNFVGESPGQYVKRKKGLKT